MDLIAILISISDLAAEFAPDAGIVAELVSTTELIGEVIEWK